MKKGIFLIMLGVFFSACKKEGQITGKVTNLFDGSPADGVPVTVVYAKDGSVGGFPRQLGSTSSDANGQFSVQANYRKNKKYEYGITVSPQVSGFYYMDPTVMDTTTAKLSTYFYSNSEYGAIPVEQNVQRISKNKAEYFEFKVVPTARLKIIATDVAPLDKEALVKVFVDDANMVSNTIFDSEYQKLENTGYRFVPPQNGKLKLKWQIRINGVYKEYRDTIALESFKKTIFKIEY